MISQSMTKVTPKTLRDRYHTFPIIPVLHDCLHLTRAESFEPRGSDSWGALEATTTAKCKVGTGGHCRSLRGVAWIGQHRIRASSPTGIRSVKRLSAAPSGFLVHASPTGGGFHARFFELEDFTSWRSPAKDDEGHGDGQRQTPGRLGLGFCGPLTNAPCQKRPIPTGVNND
jgi:hypothetical protein